jgi:hypothetical protein
LPIGDLLFNGFLGAELGLLHLISQNLDTACLVGSFSQFCDFKNLEKFPKKLAKLVDYTLGKTCF